MAHFDYYEGHDRPERLASGGFSGFLETYGTQIDGTAPDAEDETDEQKENREKFALMAEAMAWVLEHCWTGPRGLPREARDACRRFVALTMTLRPDLVGNVTFKAMANKLRGGKALLSKLSLQFSDRAGLHFRRSRRESARKKFSTVQKRIWAKRRATAASNGHVNGAPHKNGKP